MLNHYHMSTPSTRFYRWPVLVLLAAILFAGCDSAGEAPDHDQEGTLRALARSRGIEIGAAVSSNLFAQERYRKTLAREFGMLVAENEMKFGPIHPLQDTYNFSGPDAIVNLAEANDMEVRGHVLVWHAQNPNWLTGRSWTREQMIEILREHITTVVTRYKGRIKAWDVINEAVGDNAQIRQTVWLERIGPEYFALAFQFAHEADPDALLFYNDYGAEGMNPKSDKVYELVSGLVADGVPIHGVGLQMHVSTNYAPRTQDVAANMARIADLGLQVHITEMDVAMPMPPTQEKLTAQAGVYRNIMQTCLDQPACTAFVLWGFTDAHSWIPGFSEGNGAALIFDEDYQPKLAYEALKLVLSTR